MVPFLVRKLVERHEREMRVQGDKSCRKNLDFILRKLYLQILSFLLSRLIYKLILKRQQETDT